MATSPFPQSETGSIFLRYLWPVSWITLPNAGDPPYVLGFRLLVEEPRDITLRFHVTADERYELFLDGERVSRGPERGSAEAWYYETFDLHVKAGPHVLVARVWALDIHGPYAQCSVRPGFLLGVESTSDEDSPDLLARWGTGVAPWEARRIDGYKWVDELDLDVLDGRHYPWGIECGECDGWVAAQINAKAATAHPTDLYPLRLLVPGTLLPMLRRSVPPGQVRFAEDVSQVADLLHHRVDSQCHLPEFAAQIGDLLAGRSPLHIASRKKYRVIIDLQDYVCAYPEIQTSGGRDARVTISWAEALFEELSTTGPHGIKGHRSQIENLLFAGYADAFVLEGGADRRYAPLWWETGRFIQLVIETRDEPLVLHELSLEETRYPLESESTFSGDDERLSRLAPILLRTLQVNAHETFFDCPYYEQLNYTGDTLIDCLIVYTITRDVRLVRKSLQLFANSILPDGLTQSRFPSRARQVIPPFSLLWVSMVRNHAWWRGEPEFIRPLLTGTRAVLDAHLRHVNSHGLLENLRGWNFLDWAQGWEGGVPPDGDPGRTSGPLNWLLVYSLQAAAELETFAGDPELAARYTRLAQRQARATEAAFWDAERGLFADDLAHRHFSEHAQCLALLSGHADKQMTARAAAELLRATNLQRCTIYFSHYLFETFRLINQPNAFFQRLEDWFELPGRGFVTTPECPEPTRSDCHAWGSHPLFHYYATILGIRPAAMGFAEVDIRPQLGPLANVKGRMIHPLGWIEANLRSAGDELEGTITLPEGLVGTLHGAAGSQPLKPGLQKISVSSRTAF